MTKFDLLVSVASWEERFHLGLERNLELVQPRRALFFYYKEYDKWSSGDRKRARNICKRERILSDFEELSFEAHDKSWMTLKAHIGNRAREGMTVLVDISTMPRDAIWEIFFFLESLGCRIAYTYHQPGEYAPWLSRDPDRPRLVYKLSGVTSLGAPTILIAITGYDVDRTRQLFSFFQPTLGLLGIQAGDKFENNLRNSEGHLKIEGPFKFTHFPLDAYSGDHGEQAILEAIQGHAEANVVMSSLGPKPSAVALYRIQRANPSFGLCYTPSREFNPEYSKGIGESLFGWL